MIEINLLPDVKRELLRTRMMRNTVISFSILIGITSLAVTVFLAVVLGGQLAGQAIQDAAINDKNHQLSTVSDLDKTVTIQHQLKKLNEQHRNKQATSRLFDVVGATNPPAPNNVRFSSIKLDPDEKTITIEGSAERGYIALEVFKKTITNSKIQFKDDNKEKSVPLAQNVVAGETSFGENSEGKKVLRFAFTFTYPDELFTTEHDAVKVTTPTTTVDVTDSKLGIPQSLFDKKTDDNKSKRSR